MLRCLTIIIALSLVGQSLVKAAETPTNPTVTDNQPVTTGLGDSYKFVEKRPSLFAYALKQTVQFVSAGDKLEYTTTMTWKFALVPIKVEENSAQLSITILRIHATHDGPGSRRQIDSSLPYEQDGHDDPLIGHLLAVAGTELQVTVNPQTGQVNNVTGGEAVIARINKLAPPLFPGEPGPLDAAAKKTFSDEALTRMWNHLMSLPQSKPHAVPFGPPLSGALERQWTDTTWKDGLPAGTTSLKVDLLQDPTPLSVTITNVQGEGKRTVVDGLPGPCTGKLAFDMLFQALTQPVVQRHTLTWELTPLPAR